MTFFACESSYVDEDVRAGEGTRICVVCESILACTAIDNHVTPVPTELAAGHDPLN